MTNLLRLKQSQSQVSFIEIEQNKNYKILKQKIVAATPFDDYSDNEFDDSSSDFEYDSDVC